MAHYDADDDDSSPASSELSNRRVFRNNATEIFFANGSYEGFFDGVESGVF